MADADGSPQRAMWSRSVRIRLLAIALLPTLVFLPLLLGLSIQRWSGRFDATLASKVNGDLTIADQYLSRIMATTGSSVEALGASARFRDVVADGGDVPAFLEDSRATLGLDFLYLRTSERLIAAAPSLSGAPLRGDWPILERALAGTAGTAIDIYPQSELAALSASLAERSRIEIVPTANAVPTGQTVETRGMVIHSASPVALGAAGSGVLVGGILLNQNLVFIDTINDLVYRTASLPEGSFGTATLFLDDIRISTNVRLFEGRRALGTRVSAEVRQAVLEQGRTWLDRAFVVNDWYISGYMPLLDSYGRRVGMLYVGFLEAPYAVWRQETLLAIVGAFIVITALSVPIFLGWASSVFRPLEQMTSTIARVENGDLGARTGLVSSNEIGRVATHLDALLDRLQLRDRELRDLNQDLNRRVEERTRQLQIANQELEAATKQLIMSEKLAVIGEITAGVAHEINNPIAVMQGNLEVVRTIMGDRAALAKTELALIDQQIQRINKIVTDLLQFARPEEYADYVERHRPQDIIGDALPLVQHVLATAEISVVREDRATRCVLMNRLELQQVLVNLIVNAIHAMPDGGRLVLRTRDTDHQEHPGVVVEVSDTGIGMPPEVLDRVFDPFFTTKRDKGTGLGLSICQRLVTRQNGCIAVESEQGHGTTFRIWLPEAA